MAVPETGVSAPVSANQTNLVQPVCEGKISFKPLEVHVSMPNIKAVVIARLTNAMLEVTNDASK